MAFKPGESGNPSGRPTLDPKTRALLRSNGEKAVQRMAKMLAMEGLFHREGEDGAIIEGTMSSKEQIALLAIAQDRAFGRAESVSISHTHSGSVGLNVSANLKHISEQLPERLAQQRQVEDATLIEGDLIKELKG